MKTATRKLLDKALRAVHATETLLRAGDTEFAAGRAYYAMFYAAQALLNEKGLSFRKHGGVHAAFGERFVVTKLFDPKFHRWLLDAFDKRIQADYGVEAVVTAEDVEQMLSQAKEFVVQANRHLAAR